MPRKPKYSKEEIINCALKIVENKGYDYLSARTLGKELGVSSQPLFTAFRNMDEINIAVFNKAKKIYDQIIQNAIKTPLGFKAVGKAYIQFAIERPNLFKLLFSHNKNNSLNYNEVLKNIENNYMDIIEYVKKNNIQDKDKAQELYTQIWIYTHGIATLCSEKVCTFTDNEIEIMLTRAYKGLLHEIEGEN